MKNNHFNQSPRKFSTENSTSRKIHFLPAEFALKIEKITVNFQSLKLRKALLYLALDAYLLNFFNCKNYTFFQCFSVKEKVIY